MHVVLNSIFQDLSRLLLKFAHFFLVFDIFIVLVQELFSLGQVVYIRLFFVS